MKILVYEFVVYRNFQEQKYFCWSEEKNTITRGYYRFKGGAREEFNREREA